VDTSPSNSSIVEQIDHAICTFGWDGKRQDAMRWAPDIDADADAPDRYDGDARQGTTPSLVILDEARAWAEPPPDMVTDDGEALVAALNQVWAAVGEFATLYVDAIRSFFRWAADFGPFQVAVQQQRVEADPQQRALDARRNRNTGPKPRLRAPKRIDPRRSR
jgi:hypothetical protein